MTTPDPGPTAPPRPCPGCGDPLPTGTIASLCSRCLQARIATIPAEPRTPDVGRLAVKPDDLAGSVRMLLLAAGLDPRSPRLAPIPGLVAEICDRLRNPDDPTTPTQDDTSDRYA